MKKKLLSLTMALSIMASMGTTAFASNDSMTLSDETMVAITQNNLDLAKIQEQMKEVINPSLGKVVSQEIFMEEDGGYSIGTCYAQDEISSRAITNKTRSGIRNFYDGGGSVIFSVYFSGDFTYDDVKNTCSVRTPYANISRDNGFTFTNERTTTDNGGFYKKWASVKHTFTSTTKWGTSVNRTAEFRIDSSGNPSMH